MARQLGADKVTPFKKGVIVGKPGEGSPSSGNQASAKVSPEKKKSPEEKKKSPEKRKSPEKKKASKKGDK